MLLSDIWRLSAWRMSVCLSVAYIGLSREQRCLGRLNLAQYSSRHTWLRHHFQGQKFKGQGHQAALLTAVSTREASAAVTVRTYWAWETTVLRCVCSAAREALGRRHGGEGRGHMCRHAHSLFQDAWVSWVECCLRINFTLRKIVR